MITSQNFKKNLWWHLKKNDWEKIYFLQNKLMMSFEGRAVSVRKVVSNKRSKTHGFDKVVWKSPSDRFKAAVLLRRILVNKFGSYESGPVRRVWIQKSYKKDLRPLSIPNMIDRVLQVLVFLCLDPLVEEKSDLYSFGFRKFRGSHDAVQRIRTILDKSNRPMWLWDVDTSVNVLIEFHINLLKKKLRKEVIFPDYYVI